MFYVGYHGPNNCVQGTVALHGGPKTTKNHKKKPQKITKKCFRAWFLAVFKHYSRFRIHCRNCGAHKLDSQTLKVGLKPSILLGEVISGPKISKNGVFCPFFEVLGPKIECSKCFMLVTMDQKIVFREPSIHMGDLKPLKTTKKNTKNH